MQISKSVRCLGVTLALFGATATAALAQLPSGQSAADANGRGRRDLDMGMLTIPVGVSVKTDKKTYRSGDPVRITILFKNVGRAPLTLQFGSSQKYDLFILRGSGKDTEPAWNWAKGKMFMMAFTGMKVTSGKPVRFTETFDAAKENLPALTPGVYTVSASAHLMGRIPKPSGATTFTVK